MKKRLAWLVIVWVMMSPMIYWADAEGLPYAVQIPVTVLFIVGALGFMGIVLGSIMTTFED